MNSRLLALLNTIALAGVLTINALANILPINGMNTGEISALYPSLFTPAGITFSVWSVIYLLLIGFVIVQWFILDMSWFNELSMWFLVSCVANISWILAWHYLYVYASVAIMFTLLYTLIRIFLLLQKESLNNVELAFVKLPFTIYFSWICVATIANVSTLFISLPWNGAPLSEELWTVIMVTIASILSIYISIKFKALGYPLITMWALFGIYLRWNNSEHNNIAIAALSFLVVLALVFIYRLFQKK